MSLHPGIIWRLILVAAAIAIAGCSKAVSTSAPNSGPTPSLAYFKVDPSTAGSIVGFVHYKGPKPKPKPVDMGNDPDCMSANQGKVYDDSIVVGPRNGLGNAFIYIEKGLEGKSFATAQTPAVIEQKGCWFSPHVVGVQTGQSLEIVNSDPVTHNIHPMPQLNHEWNHSQGAGDPPMTHKFTSAEVMIPVKCNIHKWMHAYVGVVDNPYFAVTGEGGNFTIPNLPPGNYTLAVWTQSLGTQEQAVTVSAGKSAKVDINFLGR